jgi:hypothetical protein
MKLQLYCVVLAVIVFTGCETSTISSMSTGGGGYDPIHDGEKTTVTFSGGGGLSIHDAVIITNATENTGIRAEYVWLHEHYPGYRLRVQRLLNEEEKAYDQMDIATADGKPLSVFFDISAYLGKL